MRVLIFDYTICNLFHCAIKKSWILNKNIELLLSLVWSMLLIFSYKKCCRLIFLNKYLKLNYFVFIVKIHTDTNN